MYINRSKLAIGLVMVLALWLFIQPGPAYACICNREYHSIPPADHYDRAQSVFLGRVMSTSPGREGYYVATVRVSTVWKGAVWATMYVEDHQVCGFRGMGGGFKEGVEYLFYSSVRTGHMCSGSTTLEVGAEDLDYLRSNVTPMSPLAGKGPVPQGWSGDCSAFGTGIAGTVGIGLLVLILAARRLGQRPTRD